MSDRVALLDVNVLVALLWPRHVHHHLVRGWFAGNRERIWATCPMTEIGGVRVLATPAVSQGAMSVADAFRVLREFVADSQHVFWPDDLALLSERMAPAVPHIQSPRQLTDRYLLALAAGHDGSFVTLDRSIVASLPPGSPFRSHVEVIADGGH